MSDDGTEFIADGTKVYGFDGSGNRVLIATTEEESWAENIADVLTSDPDIYVV
jgi:hypothetical protein